MDKEKKENTYMFGCGYKYQSNMEEKKVRFRQTNNSNTGKNDDEEFNQAVQGDALCCIEHTARLDHEQENGQNITSFMKSPIQYNKNTNANISNGITLNEQFVVESIPTAIYQHK